MNQCELIKAHFNRGLSLTQLEACIQFGIGRLASRIDELISDEGYPIHKENESVKKRNGKMATVTRYSKATGEVKQNEMSLVSDTGREC